MDGDSHAEPSPPNHAPESESEPPLPPGLTRDEYQRLRPVISRSHHFPVSGSQCSSLLVQRIHAPAEHVWSFVRRFDRPQTYKHFIKSCAVGDDFSLAVGDLRYVSVVSGLPAATSTERLDFLDDDARITGFSIIGGDHRLRNYKSVTTLHEMELDGKHYTIVLESYIVNVPEGNTEEDTRLFADTVVKLNLQKLASVSETGT